MQWRNSPLTNKLVRLISTNREVERRVVEASAFDPSADQDVCRAHAARAWTCGKILETINTLCDIEEPPTK
jgi:hypothetical protein